MGPTASAPAPPLQEALGGAAAVQRRLSGRSEAPENSEANPREKGNLGLPVSLTDGSTHLEQTVGSRRAAGAVSQRHAAAESGARWLADVCVCVCGGGGAEVTGAEDSAHRGVACCLVSSIWSLEVGAEGVSSWGGVPRSATRRGRRSRK